MCRLASTARPDLVAALAQRADNLFAAGREQVTPLAPRGDSDKGDDREGKAHAQQGGEDKSGHVI